MYCERMGRVGAGAGGRRFVAGLRSPCVGYAALLLAAVLIATPAEAQQGRAQKQGTQAAEGRATDLTGWVLDAAGKPMSQVEVSLAGTQHLTRTDNRGWWRLADIPTGPRVVMARQIGYVPYVREVIVGTAVNDTLMLLLRRYPQTLARVDVVARERSVAADAEVQAERLIQMRVGSGRLYTREQILETQPYSVAELLQGVPGMTIQRLRGDGTDGEVKAMLTRGRGGAMSVGGVGDDGMVGPCEMQFFLNNTPIAGDQVGRLDPKMFRSVEVYPMNVILPGLPQRGDRCGAIVINTLRSDR